MDRIQKNDLYYKLWEFHANLLWSRVQYLIMIMVGIYTAWFLLLQLIINKKNYSFLYLILSILLCGFGVIVCHYFLKLARRDIEHQKFYEKKLPKLFREIKGEDINVKTRGRYIFIHLLNLCKFSCIALGLFSAVCFMIISKVFVCK
ncbi:MAG: hypothetical protein ACI4FV_06215 [Lachnospiraceae bacterium]